MKSITWISRKKRYYYLNYLLLLLTSAVLAHQRFQNDFFSPAVRRLGLLQRYPRTTGSVHKIKCLRILIFFSCRKICQVLVKNTLVSGHSWLYNTFIVLLSEQWTIHTQYYCLNNTYLEYLSEQYLLGIIVWTILTSITIWTILT